MFSKVNKVIKPAVIASALLLGASPSYAYTVQKGDTLSEIAEKHGMELHELSSLNPQIKNLDLIYVGDNINTNKNKTTEVGTKVNTGTYTVNVSAYEKDLLARLVEAEAKGEIYAGKVAVAYVVLNRVDSEQFPNTVSGVINQAGQFSPVRNGAINEPASEESKRAVEEALLADRSNSESLFFYNAKTASSRWLDSRPTTKVIGNHTFKK
jgi:N-acetylmuramoyl-L-alanine amidase